VMIKINKIHLAASACAISILLAGCAENLTENLTQAPQQGADTEPMQVDLWPQREITPPRDEQIEKRVLEVLSRMSLEEKVGQIIQPEIRFVKPEDVRKYHLGSVLNGGGTRPNDDKYATVQDWVDLAEEFYEASMDTSDGNSAIPLIWGSDAIHGNNNLYGATLFPHNIGLGAANDPEMIERIGQATALELVSTGVNWTFGPTVAVVRDIRWGRTYESYSEKPEIVADYARAMVRGIQGVQSKPGEYMPRNVVATAKHFLGDGGTSQGIDRGDTIATEQELIDIHAAGYIAALDSNVSTTMASFNSWNGDRLHGHEYLLTDVLKKRMGFDGLVVSDWNGHQHVTGCTVDRCAASINAGIDIMMVPSDWRALLKNTIEDVQKGHISLVRLDDAVSRILRVKLRAGLFDAGPVKDREVVGQADLIGHPEHRALAREAVRKSLVMLKNNNNILPLSPKANILVAGDAAHNIGKQAGGWTLSWQGTGNTNDDFPGATSVYAGIKSVVEAAGGSSHLDEKGDWNKNSFTNGQKPNVAVVVYGEEPYAEWHGDIANIEYQYGNKQDIKLLKKLKEQGIPVVSVFISGRPLWINKELNASDAFVAAWLPGSEGDGVADLILSDVEGNPRFDYQGKLSFSWPKDISQAKLNAGDATYSPLFPYGYGLTYANNKALPAGLVSNDLDESTQLPANAELEEYWVFVSREMSAWTFNLQDEGAESVVVSSNRQVSSGDENLLFEAVDRVAQQDARRIVWKGNRPATLSITTPYAQDFSQYVENDGVLSFDLKVDQAPAANSPEQYASLSMICGDECSKSIDLTTQLRSATLAEYQRYEYDLSCFIAEGAKVKTLTSVLKLTANSAMDISVANIKVLPKMKKQNQQVTTCD